MADALLLKLHTRFTTPKLSRKLTSDFVPEGVIHASTKFGANFIRSEAEDGD
jgi:hypothetical protein